MGHRDATLRGKQIRQFGNECSERVAILRDLDLFIDSEVHVVEGVVICVNVGQDIEHLEL
jgi:hypothetical protein